MILDRLTLDGFRLHRRTDVEFGPGLTAIIGANGAGKSTLLESISFALFGEQRGTRDTLRGDDGGPYRVRLEFRMGGVPYAVERRPDRAFLTQGEKKIAEGLSDTTRACARLLGLTYEQFRNSFLAEQKGLAFLRFRNAAARQQEVGRMLGLDRLRFAEAKAADVRRAAGIEAKALEPSVGDESAIRAALREAEAALKAAQTERSHVEAERKQAEERWAKAEPEGKAAERYLGLVAQASAAREAFRLAQASLNAAGAALESARQEANQWIELAPEADRFETLTGLRPNLVAAQKATAAALALDSGVLIPVEEAQERLDRADRAHRAWSAERQRERGGSKEALRTAQSDLKAAESADGEAPCPVCGRPLGAEAHAWKEELQERVRKAELRCALAEGPDDPATANEVQRWQRLRQAAELRAESDRLSLAFPAGLKVLEEELERLAPRAKLAQSLAGAERRRQDAQSRFSQAQKELERAGEANERADAALRETGVRDAESAQTSIRQAAAARTSVEATRAALRASESALHAAEAALHSSEARFEEAAKRRDALREARHIELLNGAVATEMRQLRTALNGALRPDLEARAGELLERMTAGRYRRLRLSAEFEPTVIDDETDRAILSGGEEDVVALALRLALAELVQDRQGHSLTLLMLDEAFGALDRERRQSLLDVLTGLRERYEQVIVVSHVEDVAQVADRVLRVVRDDTGAARVNEL